MWVKINCSIVVVYSIHTQCRIVQEIPAISPDNHILVLQTQVCASVCMCVSVCVCVCACVAYAYACELHKCVCACVCVCVCVVYIYTCVLRYKNTAGCLC